MKDQQKPCGQMPFRLIALDIDGTLTNDRKEITPKTREALKAAQERGCRLALVSGRPQKGLEKESKLLEMNRHHGLLISYNGGKITDATTKEVLLEQSIPRDTAVSLLRHLRQFDGITRMMDDGTHLLADRENGYRTEYESQNSAMPLRTVRCLADAAAQMETPPFKIMMAAPPETLRDISDALSAPFEDALSFQFTAPFYYEATAKGISKATALEKVCQILYISPREVIAFGDAQNDIPMICFAGWGVSMGNGCQELKEKADEITCSNNDDGIAKTLQRIFSCP